MRKWYMLWVLMILLLFQWKVLRVKRPKRIRVKFHLPQQKVVPFQRFKIPQKIIIQGVVFIFSTMLMWYFTGYPVPIIFGGMKVLATDGAGYPMFNNIIYPSAINYNDVTYVVYQGADFDPYITSNVDGSHSWATPVKIADTPLTDDDHGAPCIAIDNDGYIHVFFGCHNTALKHSKSDSVEDISAWTAQSDASSSDATYPSIITDGDNMYLFYRRGASTNSKWYYRVSANNGSTWGSETLIIDFYTDDSVTVYAYFCDAYDSTNGRFHVTWAYRSASSPNPNYNIYHAYLNISDGKMYAMDGTDLGATIDKTEADADCIVHTQTTYGVSHLTIHLDSSGNPYITWNEATDDPETDWKGMFIYYNGSSWESVVTIVTTLAWPFHSDFLINSSTSIEGYFGVERDGSKNDIEGWRWNGSTWTKVNTIISNAITDNALGLAKMVVNYDESLKFILTEVGLPSVQTELVVAYHTFLITWDLDFAMGALGESDDNYEIGINKHNPGITSDQMELESIKGDEFDIDSATDCFKETIDYNPTSMGGAVAGSDGGSTDKNTTTTGRRRISVLSASGVTKYGVQSDFGYSGDFDVECQLNLITLLATTGSRNGLYLGTDTNNFVYIGRDREAGGNWIFAYCTLGGVNQGGTTFNTTDVEIWVRVTRVSDTITAYYKLNEGDGWTQLDSWATVWTTVAYPCFGIYSYTSKPDVVMEISNWKLNSGRVGTGGYRSSGTFDDTGILTPDGKRIKDLRIDYGGISAIYTATVKILKLSDSSVLYTASAITSGTRLTYDTDDFGTITDDIKITVDFATDADDTAYVTEIEGSFENIPGGGHHGRAPLLIPLISMICRVKRRCKWLKK